MNEKNIYNNIIMLTIGAILLLCFLLIGSTQLVQADENIRYEKYFTSIEIRQGDTLTTLADDYAVSKESSAAYIDEVKRINHLKSDAIHAGSYLVIPQYKRIP